MRFSVPTAVAKSLSELEREINPDVDRELILNTDIKTGGDGMGGAPVYREKGDR